MFGIGISEMLILLVVLGMGIAGLALIYFVVRAAVRAANRDKSPKD